MKSKTTATTAVMIRPTNFCINPDTVASNSFQTAAPSESQNKVLVKAQNEFLQFQKKLIANGIKILNFEESTEHYTPDALFPNNWFCQLPDGRVFIFPMYPKNRRLEYRKDIIEKLNPKTIIDLRYLENEAQFLEGTGSLVLDHENCIAFACLSPRTTAEALTVFSEISGYKLIVFESTNEKNQPIYHTNVMMALSPKNAVINLSSIQNIVQKNNLIHTIQHTGRNIVDISNEEMNHFAGNMLFLKNSKQQSFWVCSKKAYDSLSVENRKALESEAPFIYADLDTIETHGGGGARCLLAEVF